MPKTPCLNVLEQPYKLEIVDQKSQKRQCKSSAVNHCGAMRHSVLHLLPVTVLLDLDTKGIGRCLVNAVSVNVKYYFTFRFRESGLSKPECPRTGQIGAYALFFRRKPTMSDKPPRRKRYVKHSCQESAENCRKLDYDVVAFFPLFDIARSSLN